MHEPRMKWISLKFLGNNTMHTSIYGRATAFAVACPSNRKPTYNRDHCAHPIRRRSRDAMAIHSQLPIARAYLLVTYVMPPRYRRLRNNFAIEERSMLQKKRSTMAKLRISVKVTDL
ncbi:hypothetical protein K474DRAFT_423019 [Panus rudis PR-1116 ss-1]|nr:hypothetical protein K474DRAFT_423019 [Panus rudis PR-1116 ss-1]